MLRCHGDFKNSPEGPVVRIQRNMTDGWVIYRMHAAAIAAARCRRRIARGAVSILADLSSLCHIIMMVTVF